MDTTKISQFNLDNIISFETQFLNFTKEFFLSDFDDTDIVETESYQLFTDIDAKIINQMKSFILTILNSTTDGSQISEEFSDILPTTDQAVVSEWVKITYYAAVGNNEKFVESVKQLNLRELTADTIKQIIDYSLDMGLIIMARNLSEQGAMLHTENDELQKYHRILSPPKVIRKDLPPYPQAELNVRWLKENRATYQGQWVAIKEGILLASAPSARELVTKFECKKNSKILITRV